MTLEAVPGRRYSRNYVILQDGPQLAEIKLGLFREQGSIALEGQTCSIRRDGLRGPFLYEAEGAVLAQAWMHSVKRCFEIEYEGQHYSLRAVEVEAHLCPGAQRRSVGPRPSERPLESQSLHRDRWLSSARRALLLLPGQDPVAARGEGGSGSRGAAGAG
jgi:hypothetical protein